MQMEYLGLPERYWKELTTEIEEILIEEEIGQYILGLYPSGDRVFGLEQGPVEMFCLYINSIDDILDPFRSSQKPKVLESRNASCRFVFQEFWSWIQDIKNSLNFTHFLVSFYDSLSEEDSIVPIINLIQNLLEKNQINYYENTKAIHFLEEKAISTFYRTGQFVPNINPKFGEAITDSKIQNLVNKKINNEHISFIDKIPFLSEYSFITKLSSSYQENLDQISKETIKFYRYFL